MHMIGDESEQQATLWGRERYIWQRVVLSPYLFAIYKLDDLSIELNNFKAVVILVKSR